MLKLAPIQQVSGLISDQDGKSTMAYNRYTLDQIKGRDLMDKVISNVKDEEGIKKEGKEEIKQRIIKEIKQELKVRDWEKSKEKEGSFLIVK